MSAPAAPTAVVPPPAAAAEAAAAAAAPPLSSMALGLRGAAEGAAAAPPLWSTAPLPSSPGPAVDGPSLALLALLAAAAWALS